MLILTLLILLASVVVRGRNLNVLQGLALHTELLSPLEQSPAAPASSPARTGPKW